MNPVGPGNRAPEAFEPNLSWHVSCGSQHSFLCGGHGAVDAAVATEPDAPGDVFAGAAYGDRSTVSGVVAVRVSPAAVFGVAVEIPRATA